MSVEINNQTPRPAGTPPSEAIQNKPPEAAVPETTPPSAPEQSPSSNIDGATVPPSPLSSAERDQGLPESEATAALKSEFESRFAELAGDKDRFADALSMSMGPDYDRGAAEGLRNRALEGDFSWVPNIALEDPGALGSLPAKFDAAAGVVRVNRDLASDPATASDAVARGMGEALGQTVNARGAEGTIGEYFGFFTNPAQDPYVARYLAAGEANTANPPFGLETWGYGSAPPDSGAVAFSADQPPYINGAVGTPPEVGELNKAGGANFLQPGWLGMVDDAVRRNGGLGDAENGFLAFSIDHGFVRLRNTGQTPEENRQLAAVSLQTGWPVETLPSRFSDSEFNGGEHGAATSEFLGNYAKEFQNFLANPKENGIEVKSGKRNYNLRFDEGAGGFVSYQFKKRGGIGGFVQDNFKAIMYGVGAVATVLTMGGYALVAGAVSSLATTGMSWIATGSLKASQAIQGIASGLAGMMGLSGAQAVAVGAAAQVAGDLADDGDLDMDASDLVGAVAPLITGLPGGPIVDRSVAQSLELIAQAAEGDRVKLGDVVDALAPLVLELPAGSARDKLEAVAQKAANGQLTAAEVTEALKPVLGSLTGSPETDGFILSSLDLLAAAVDGDKLSAMGLFESLEGFFLERLEGTTTGKILHGIAEAADEELLGDGLGAKEAWDIFRDVSGLSGKDLADYVFSREQPDAESKPAA